MKILVVGSLNKVRSHADICGNFVARLGERIIERGHILLTGCRGSVDKTIAEAASIRLQSLSKRKGQQLIGCVLKNEIPVHRFGTIRISARKDWDLSHPELSPPEQIANADVAIFIAGTEGTFIAANWARIAGIPVLGVAQFGGAGAELYEHEYNRFDSKYSSVITRDEFEILIQDSTDVEQLATDVIALAERIVTPRTVFPVIPFTDEYLEDVLKSWKQVCTGFGFEIRGTEGSNNNERIIPQILDGIRHSAFVIADVTEIKPNVFYEIGFAQGLGKEVILTAKKGTQLPFDLADLPVVFWHTHAELREQLNKRITTMIRIIRMSPTTRQI